MANGKGALLKKAISILSKHGVKKITLFGSYASGHQKKGSDLDLIVDFDDQKSLLELVRIEMEASKKLGVKVDLLTEKALSPHIAGKIERVVIYGG